MNRFALAIVLLYSTQFQTAFADSTLHFSQLSGKQSKATQSYQIKSHLLRLSDSQSQRINLFNSKDSEFISFDTQSNQQSKLNEKILGKRLTQLNQKRQQHIRKVEARMEAEMKKMSQKEQEIATSLLNQLKYPDLYGGHTLLELTPSMESKTIQEIPCTVYKLYQQTKLIKSFCMAQPKDLKLTQREYKTLRDFYRFDYSTQSRIMLASGKGDFKLVDLDKLKISGVIIEQISYRKGRIAKHLILNRLEQTPLDDSLFNLDKIISSSKKATAPAKP